MILYKNNKANNIILEIDDDKKYTGITFDYLDYKDGFIIELLHTGNEDTEFKIRGTIKTIGLINNRKLNEKKPFIEFIMELIFNFINKIKNNIIRLILFFVFLLAIIGFLCMIFYLFYSNNLIITGAIIILFLLQGFSLPKPQPLRSIPKEFRKFLESIG